jgi:prophage regulatory protein
MHVQQPVHDQRSSADTRFTNPILPFKILRLPKVLEMVGIRKSGLYQRIKNGTFPAPINIGIGRAVGWIEAEVIQWFSEQIQKSRTEPCIKQKVCVKRPAEEGAEVPAKVGVEVPAKGGAK